MARFTGSSSGMRASGCSKGGLRAPIDVKSLHHGITFMARSLGVEEDSDAVLEVDEWRWTLPPTCWNQTSKHTCSGENAVVVNAAVDELHCWQVNCKKICVQSAVRVRASSRRSANVRGAVHMRFAHSCGQKVS